MHATRLVVQFPSMASANIFHSEIDSTNKYTPRNYIIIWAIVISVQYPTTYIILYIMQSLDIISYRLRVIYGSFGIYLPIESVTKRRFLSPMIDRIHCVVFFYSCNTRPWVAVFCSSAETLKKYVNIIITIKKKNNVHNVYK